MISKTIMPIYQRKLASFSTLSRNTSALEHKDLSILLTGFFKKDLPTSRKVTMIRHAESFGNTQKLLYGSTDFELTPFGESQARSLQPALESMTPQINQIYCSSLIRTLQTAQQSLGLDLEDAHSQIIKTPGLNEFDFGALEESPFDKLSYDESRFILNLILEGRFFYNFIETPQKVDERLFGFFASLEPNQNDVVYSHSGMTYVILRKWEFLMST